MSECDCSHRVDEKLVLKTCAIIMSKCDYFCSDGFDDDSYSVLCLSDRLFFVCFFLQPYLQCVQQQTGESSGQGSDGDCGCPTGLSVRNTSPPPPGWDEIWQNRQTPLETGERGEGMEMKREKNNCMLHVCGAVLC